MQNKLVNLLENTAAPHLAVGFSDDITSREIVAARSNGLDVAELRIDSYSNHAPNYVLQKVTEFSDMPTIATIRSKKEGGNWNGSDNDRLKLFKEIIPHVDSVDIELASTTIIDDVVAIAKKQNKQVIISYHNFDITPTEEVLNEVITDSLSKGANIIKIATHIQDEKDTNALTQLLLTNKDKKLIVIGMGAQGAITRMTFPSYGSLLTFGFIKGNSTAPGQMPLKDLVWKLRGMYPKYNERQIIDNQLLECA